MTMRLSIAPILAIVAGSVILVRPQWMYLIVGVYLIVVGVLGLVHP